MELNCTVCTELKSCGTDSCVIFSPAIIQLYNLAVFGKVLAQCFKPWIGYVCYTYYTLYSEERYSLVGLGRYNLVLLYGRQAILWCMTTMW